MGWSLMKCEWNVSTKIYFSNDSSKEQIVDVHMIFRTEWQLPLQ